MNLLLSLKNLANKTNRQMIIKINNQKTLSINNLMIKNNFKPLIKIILLITIKREIQELIDKILQIKIQKIINQNNLIIQIIKENNKI